ncbi:MAG TPA: cytochrome c3 family protein, partial [Burkholderiales bacterium]|nr:cytochrome c3 family protein [Burkholderiales bacterium]
MVAPVLLLLLMLPGLALAQVSIVSSKHNLSSSGTGSIKASSESQICVFCHTPHGSSSIAQLWNKQTTSADYTLYSSDYITSLPSYPAPAQPKTRSKLCLSCHDGTVALGSVYNLPGSGGGSGGTIAMTQSGSPITTMPAGAAGYLGTSLTNDHPVGYMYDRTKDPELADRGLWPWNTAVKLDPDASTGTVECQTCHEPHNNQFTKFLRVSNANAALCTFCHAKTDYDLSGHRNSTAPYTPPGGTATTVGEYSCRSCHKPHSSGGTPYILRGAEENTCYERGCHGTNTNYPDPATPATPAARLIQPELSKTHAHPVNTFTD